MSTLGNRGHGEPLPDANLFFLLLCLLQLPPRSTSAEKAVAKSPHSVLSVLQLTLACVPRSMTLQQLRESFASVNNEQDQLQSVYEEGREASIFLARNLEVSRPSSRATLKLSLLTVDASRTSAELLQTSGAKHERRERLKSVETDTMWQLATALTALVLLGGSFRRQRRKRKQHASGRGSCES